MFTAEMLRMFPRKRIKAADGMAVTAEVWEEAHEYHRQLARFHALLNHGTGIVTGLEVIASEPADSSVYILPGIAVDTIGQTIVVPEPRAFDMGRSDGLLYLIVSFGESRPQVANGRAQEDSPLYIHQQYALEAVTQLPATPHVELARVMRRGGAGNITAARDPLHPEVNEIDLRYRRHIGYEAQTVLSIGVSTLPGAENSGHGDGIGHMARSLQHLRSMPVFVDKNVRLGPGLERYTLLCLVGRDAFNLNSDQMTALWNYLQQGGTIFYESCRRMGEGEPAADASFLALSSTLNVPLRVVESSHSLLRTPHLFGLPADGYESRGTPSLQAGEGVIFSTFDYGCIWRGERRGRPASRSEIRNAIEWGENLLAYAAERQRRFAPSSTAAVAPRAAAG
jgi:hypothetical protein